MTGVQTCALPISLYDDGFKVEVDEDALLAEAIGDLDPSGERAAKRIEHARKHMEAITEKLDRVREATAHGRLHGTDAIGVRVGKVINKYKVGKHFNLVIGENGFDYEIDQGKEVGRASWWERV